MRRDDEAERLTGARWSSATRCARMGAYSALGTIPSAPSSDAVAGMFERGHDLEDVYARRLAERYSGPVAREVEIPWGGGDWRLHCDFVLPDNAREHVEVKSNTDINTIPGAPVKIAGVETKASVLQVVGAAVFDPEGGTATVAVISPTTYQHRDVAITITADLEGAAREIAELVRRAVETGELPERVCQVPSDAIGRFCPYADTCFASWEPAETVVEDGPVAILAGQLRRAEDAYREVKAELAQIEKERAEARRRMADYTKPGIEYVLGGVRVRRTVGTKGRRTFKLADALACGALDPSEINGPLSRLGNFVTTSSPQERWTVGDPVVEDET